MREKALTLAVAAVLFFVFFGRCPAMETATLWPKILKILEKVEGMEAQNREILQNQQRILTEMEELRTSIQQMDERPGVEEGEEKEKEGAE